MDRKGMKVAAKKAQRKHYWMIVASRMDSQDFFLSGLASAFCMPAQ